MISAFCYNSNTDDSVVSYSFLFVSFSVPREGGREQLYRSSAGEKRPLATICRLFKLLLGSEVVEV